MHLFIAYYSHKGLDVKQLSVKTTRNASEDLWCGASYPKDHKRGRILLLLVLNPECELTCSNNFRDKQGLLKLMVEAVPHITRYNVISATVGFVNINVKKQSLYTSVIDSHIENSKN